MVAHSSPLNRTWLILCRLLAASGLALLAGVPPGPAIDLGSGHTLEPRLTFTDQLGQTHTRLVHRYQGLRVWGDEPVSHQSPAPGARPVFTGSPALPLLDPGTPLAEPLDLDLTPSVTLEAAQEAIRPGFGAAAASVTFSSPELVVYPRSLDLPLGVPARGKAELDATQVHQHLAGYALAYLIQAHGATGHALTDVWTCLVDAHTGKMLERIPVNQGVAPAQAAGPALAAASPEPAANLGATATTPVVGIGNSLYSGTVELEDSANASGYLMLDTTRGQGGVFGGNAVTDMKHNTFGPTVGGVAYPKGTVYANTANVWGNGTAPAPLSPTTTPAGQTVAVDAAYGLQATWDYYGQVHQRNGIDGLGSATYVQVNYGGNQNDVDNAYWSSSAFAMTIEDGVNTRPYTNLTVMAHEFTHGVTRASAGLIYDAESGGLNEATSDIFGVMAATYANGTAVGTIPATGANWYIPRYLANGAMVPLRYLDKPSRDGVSRDAWSPGLGSIDVHFSSGPMNRAFYFLSQGASANPAAFSYSTYLPGGMTGISNDEADQIWYRALNVYLTPTSNYKQARTAALRSALDLFPPDASGNASRETIAVRKAFGAINVGDPNATVDDLGNPGIAAQVAPGINTPSGADLILSAVATDPYGVNEVDYFVDQVLVAATFNPPSFTVPQFDPSHLLANGSHALSSAAYDSSGNQGVSLSVPFSVNNPVQQLLRDPGLEGGGLGWQGDTNTVIQTDYTGTIAHGGYRYASFDRGSGAQSLTLSQQLPLPGGTSALLSLWTQVQGNPALPPTDTLQVLVQPPAPAAAVLLDTLSNQQNRADWLRRSYDLSAYLGQTVTVSLVSNINPGTGTAFLVDDITLACSAPAVSQVQVQVSLTPGAFGPAPLTVNGFGVSGPIGPLYAQVTGSPGSTAVTWSILEGSKGGRLSSGANPTYQFASPFQPGFFHVVATSVADPNVSAQVSINGQNFVNLVPASASLATGATLPFTVSTAPGITAGLSVSGGTLGPGTGPGQTLYTAPAVPGTYTLTALGTYSGVPVSATATITVVGGIQVTVTPSAMTVVPGSTFTLNATVTGTANTNVTWTIQEGAAGGTIANPTEDGDPVYTAPASPGTYHLIATSAASPTSFATLTVTVASATIVINPATAVTLTGGTFNFQAFTTGNQAVTWSVPAGPSAGSIDGNGLYTAPATASSPGGYGVQATLAGGSLSASASVQVLSTNFSSDGKPFMNSADLAILADAWGGTLSPLSANWNPLCDLNLDGVVNDQDVALFFSQFGGLP
jgi:hypothetical protein